MESGWNQCQVVSPAIGVDSIVEDIMIDNPDFIDIDALTIQIKKGNVKFIQEVKNFLSRHQI